MKKFSLFVLTLCLLHTTHIYAQPCGAHFSEPGDCLDFIPSEAIIVSSDLAVPSAVNQCYWVCTGATLSISSIASGNLNINMEAGSTLNFSGNESSIWAKEGCVINLGACMPIIVIKMEATVDVNFDAGGAACIAMDTCATVFFDYTDAPGGGCVVDIENNDRAENKITIYPNPAHDILHVEFENYLTEKTEFVISDLQGKMILRQFIQTTNDKKVFIPLPATAQGIYILSIGDEIRELIAID